MDEARAAADKKYMTTTQLINALKAHLERDETDEAARLYSRCHEDVGFILMTRMPRDRPLQARMARMFWKAKDFEKAALVLEANEEYQRAGELYERTDQFENAAEIWLKVGDKDRAAHNFEKCGLWQRAAEVYTEIDNLERAAYCFEKAVNHFLAGKYYYHVRKYDKAMELLQYIAETDEGYVEASVMIGNILAANGSVELAVDKYRSVASRVEPEADNLLVFYNLARLLERVEDWSEAHSAYCRIVEVDPGYQDAAARAEELRERAAEAEQGGDDEDDEEDIANLVDHVTTLAEDIMPIGGMERYMAQKNTEVVSVMDGFEFLKSTSLFDRLSLSEMKRMWNICEVRSFDAGELVIEQDRPGQALYVVKWGDVRVQRVDEGQVSDLVTLGPGSHVGEMSLVDMAPTSARVVAGHEGAQAFEITRERFDELLESDYRIAIKVYKVFIETMCDRLRKTTSELSGLKARVSAAG